MDVCKQCRWYQAAANWDPSEGECKPPTDEEASNPGFMGMRHVAKSIMASDPVCERYELAGRGGKYHDVV